MNELITVATGGTSGNGISGKAQVDPSGRFVVFNSFASDLVSGDGNGDQDVFLRDRTDRVTSLVSVSTTGGGGDGPSNLPVISPGGRLVTFNSGATNLVPVDPSGGNAFYRDLCTVDGIPVPGCTPVTRVIGALPPVGLQSIVRGFTSDLRYFGIRDLVSGFSAYQGLLFDRCETGTGPVPGCTASNEIFTKNAAGVPGNQQSVDGELMGITPNGRHVAFHSNATNIVEPDGNLTEADIFVRDRCMADGEAVPGCTPTVARISIDSSGVQLTKRSSQPSITPDGRFVVYQTEATEVAGPTPNAQQYVVLHDRDADQDGIFDEPGSVTTELISVAHTGGDLECAPAANCRAMIESPGVSADGRFVLFFSDAINVVAGVADGLGHLYLRDRQTATTAILDVDCATGQVANDAIDGAGSASMTPDASTVVLTSRATNLVTDGDSLGDVFVSVRCSTLCGNGVIDAACETCDDGNTTAGDGCAATCQVEPGWSCSGEPSVCDECGNGIVGGTEQCDLGPPTAGGGNCPSTTDCDTCSRSCSHDCRLQGRCSGSSACCATAADCPVGEGCCGNGLVEAPEACDDGNLAGGDTCTPQCQADTGPPLTCCPRGAEIAAATVAVKKKVKLTRLGGASGDEMLKSAGEAILAPGQDTHPCAEGATYCLEGASGILWGSDDDDGIPGPDPISVSDPQVTGAQMRTPCIDTASPRRVRAKYADKGRPPVGSDPDGVKRVDVKNIASQPNKLKYKVDLRDVNLTAVSAPVTLRQTVVVGDTCLVLKLECAPAGTTKAICVPST